MTRPGGPSTPSPPPGPKLLARIAEPIRVTTQIAWALTVLAYDVAADIHAHHMQHTVRQGRRP